MTAAIADPSTHLFWIISRGAGTTALILASASICFGLAMSGSLIKRGGADRRIYHEMLSLSVMVAIAVHGLSLNGDSFLHPSLADVTVPFVSSYMTLSTSLGIIAGWALIFLGLSYYLRDRIGRQRWKLIHRFTLLAWIAGLVHTFTEGTDAGQIWFIALIVVTSAPAVMLLVLRLTGRQLPAGLTGRLPARRFSSPRRPAPR
jgi:sulfoxide reductase heme-binding subunit YedZ